MTKTPPFDVQTASPSTRSAGADAGLVEPSATVVRPASGVPATDAGWVSPQPRLLALRRNLDGSPMSDADPALPRPPAPLRSVPVAPQVVMPLPLRSAASAPAAAPARRTPQTSAPDLAALWDDVLAAPRRAGLAPTSVSPSPAVRHLRPGVPSLSTTGAPTQHPRAKALPTLQLNLPPVPVPVALSKAAPTPAHSIGADGSDLNSRVDRLVEALDGFDVQGLTSKDAPKLDLGPVAAVPSASAVLSGVGNLLEAMQRYDHQRRNERMAGGLSVAHSTALNPAPLPSGEALAQSRQGA